MADRKAAVRREKFATEYIKDANGRQAAIRAGYSPKSAHVTASRLLNDAKVQARIAALIAKRGERLEIDQDRIVRGLLLEAVGRGPDTSSSARTKAWTNIARLLGHDPAVKLRLQVDLASNQEFQDVVVRIVNALAPFPDAAAVVAEALDGDSV